MAGLVKKKNALVLFDVDGTLTVPRKRIEPEMRAFLDELKKHVTVGVVGGSDLVKIREQVGEDVTDIMDFCFSENGLNGFKAGALFHEQSFVKKIGEEALKEFINFVLAYLAKVDVPVKRGTFIEYRMGMLNVSPIGRACSQEERDAFEAFDKEAKVRETMVKALEAEFGDRLGLKFSIGGQISFDVFPKGWDKTYCLQFVEGEGFDSIHFFGDKTFPGGNDHEIFEDKRTVGHTVTSWQDSMRMCTELFMTDA